MGASKFRRVIDSSYPREWIRWEADGITWVIQDLLPEDDERALEILINHFLPDEVMSNCCGVTSDPESTRSLENYWRGCLLQRMSLGCYTVINDSKTLAALNVCIVKCKNDETSNEFDGTGEGWKSFCISFGYIDKKVNCFEVLNTDKVLYAMGLCVMKEYRGAKLGARLLAAREPLSKYHGITGSATIFTGIASQKCATKAGFVTAKEVPFTELADKGLPFPRDERVIKYMVKKFN